MIRLRPRRFLRAPTGEPSDSRPPGLPGDGVVLDAILSRWTGSALPWVALAALIVGMEYLLGPEVRLSILYVIPVGFAAWFAGRRWGLSLALLLPLARLSFYLAVWTSAQAVSASAFNALVRVLLLMGVVYLVDRVQWQSRRIKRLEGILRICMFCKQIRDEDERWHEIESYLSAHTDAEFSHFICPHCAQEHYGYRE